MSISENNYNSPLTTSPSPPMRNDSSSSEYESQYRLPLSNIVNRCSSLNFDSYKNMLLFYRYNTVTFENVLKYSIYAYRPFCLFVCPFVCPKFRPKGVLTSPLLWVGVGSKCRTYRFCQTLTLMPSEASVFHKHILNIDIFKERHSVWICEINVFSIKISTTVHNYMLSNRQSLKFEINKNLYVSFTSLVNFIAFQKETVGRGREGIGRTPHRDRSRI